MQTNDIDIKNRIVYVRQGKGKKDRVSILADSIIPLLTKYLRDFTPHEFLFYGRNIDNKISNSAIRWAFNGSLKRAGIPKRKICIHSLRHSFASHLLQVNTNIVTIQQLLGHEDIRTTMKYLHLNVKSVAEVKSPLDIIVLCLKKKVQK